MRSKATIRRRRTVAHPKKKRRSLGSKLKKLYNFTKPFHKHIAKAALYGGGVGLSALTGSPAPMVAAKVAGAALFSTRNRYAGAVAAHPTGAKT